MRGFRLLRAVGSFEMRDRPSFFDSSDRPSELLDIEFAPDTDGSNGSWVSVVIGRNGVGKSRILAGIADVLDSIGGRPLRRDGFTVSRIEYLIDDQHCIVEVDGNRVRKGTVNGRAFAPASIPLPKKIVALTTTPFDKFRISRAAQGKSDGAEPEEQDRYAYLGLRDRTGRASTTAAIFRALEGLFEASASSSERRVRIADVFEFLGYTPRIDVKYQVSPGEAFRTLVDIVEGVSLDYLRERQRSTRSPRPIDRLLDDPYGLDQVRAVGKEVLQRLKFDSNTIELHADFHGISNDDGFFRRIQALRRFGLISMKSVLVERRVDGAVLDLRMASSGELGMVSGFLGVASVIRSNSLIFVDEPEISLHPEWQTKYVELLTKTFEHYRGCHFVLATHSPLILSDINPEASNVVSLDPDRRRVESARDFAGKSYDFLLATAFDEPGNNNMYLKEEIIKALRLAADGRVRSKEFLNALRVLTDSLPKLDPESSVAKLIGELKDVSRIEAAR